MPAQIIDKGIPTAGLLAQVLVAKYADHLPLYRQETIFARAGMALPRSTLSAWVGMCGVHVQPLVDALKDEILSHAVLHADETPVAMLKPGNKKTHRAYLWTYAPGAFEDLKAVIYDFRESRAGAHARTFLGEWKGALVCDDFSGYKQSFTLGVTEAGCMAHVQRKFFELHASNKWDSPEITDTFLNAERAGDRTCGSARVCRNHQNGSETRSENRVARLTQAAQLTARSKLEVTTRGQRSAS